MERLKIAKKPLIIWLLLMLVVMIITIFMTQAPLASVPLDAEKMREANFHSALDRILFLALEIMFDLFGCFMICIYTWQNGDTKVKDMTPKQKFIRTSYLWLITMTGIQFLVILLFRYSPASEQASVTSQASRLSRNTADTFWVNHSFILLSLVSGIMIIGSLGFGVIAWHYHRRPKSLTQQT